MASVADWPSSDLCGHILYLCLFLCLLQHQRLRPSMVFATHLCGCWLDVDSRIRAIIERVVCLCIAGLMVSAIRTLVALGWLDRRHPHGGLALQAASGQGWGGRCVVLALELDVAAFDAEFAGVFWLGALAAGLDTGLCPSAATGPDRCGRTLRRPERHRGQRRGGHSAAGVPREGHGEVRLELGDGALRPGLPRGALGVQPPPELLLGGHVLAGRGARGARR
mmetsp:Transcript_113079/g.365236  ORF Transcript_113079/g.365236 Transcript_113079/m.365236 type:complete len:223 (-) Transcript_113079:269-937(-)